MWHIHEFTMQHLLTDGYDRLWKLTSTVLVVKIVSEYCAL